MQTELKIEQRPVAYLVTGPDGDENLTRQPLTEYDKKYGWTETPLFDQSLRPTAPDDDPDGAIAAWNTRTEPTPAAPDEAVVEREALCQKTVTQFHREAAARLAEWLIQNEKEYLEGKSFFHEDFPTNIRQGIWDKHPWVQAFII